MGFLKNECKTLRYDYILIAVILLLTLFGLATLYSASYLFASNQPQRFPNGYRPLYGNLFACGLMIALFPIMVMFKLEWLKRGWVIFLLLLITFTANILPFLERFQGKSVAMRWIFITEGINFQPSELIKVALPLYLAYILNKNNDKLNSFVYGPLPPLIITALFCILVLRQSNFSDAVFLALMSMLICFIAGIRLRWFILALLIVILAAYALIFSDEGGIRYQRIHDFFSNEASPPELREQIDFSLDAIRSGGFWGKGIGQGTVKIIVPEVHGDFVFASFAEETGFLGVLFYLFLIGVFAGIGYMAAWRSKERFARILAFGLVTPIVLQTLLNIAVVVEAVPTTGVPLPFVSSGGSSLLTTLIGAALLVNVTRRYVKSGDARG